MVAARLATPARGDPVFRHGHSGCADRAARGLGASDGLGVDVRHLDCVLSGRAVETIRAVVGALGAWHCDPLRLHACTTLLPLNQTERWAIDACASLEFDKKERRQPGGPVQVERDRSAIRIDGYGEGEKSAALTLWVHRSSDVAENLIVRGKAKSQTVWKVRAFGRAAYERVEKILASSFQCFRTVLRRSAQREYPSRCLALRARRSAISACRVAMSAMRCVRTATARALPVNCVNTPTRSGFRMLST